MMTVSLRAESVMRLAPVIPVLVIENVSYAMPIARALVAGGLRALEVTLRTPAALDVIREMVQIPGAVVGAGTVLDEHSLDAALLAGAQFIVSPGFTDRLARTAIDRDVAFLPGVATASDVMRGLDLGLDRFKFFPAEALGGINALKALSAPFSQARFCPTGGITPSNATEWLAMESVLCVGGTWLVSRSAPDMGAIEVAARAATQLARSNRRGALTEGGSRDQVSRPMHL